MSMSREVAIGIDLGTSNSCAAVVTEGQPRVLRNAFGESLTASVVHFGADGSINVGNRARANIILDPAHTVASAKRLIGRYIFSEEVQKAKAVFRYEIVGAEGNGVRIKIREELLSLPEISAFVLREMKQLAERELGLAVTQAVITVPAYFNDNQRQATKDAGRIAGLDVLRILNEPTAAALAYGFGRNLKQRVAVYDLGGGTFDVSVLEIDGDVFEVMSTCGDTYLGGDDFDDRLIDLLADRIRREHGVNVRTDPLAHERLKQAAEQAKRALSLETEAPIEIKNLTQAKGGPLDLATSVTRQELAKLTIDLVQRTFKVCDEAMQNAGLTIRDLDGLILVGGMTRSPVIRDAVRQYFGMEPEANINPDEVVAVGAAIHAASLGTRASDSFLLDVTPLSLRLGIAGGLTEPIIERNSPVPIDHTRVFMPARDQQTSVRVDIYQGESRRAEDNERLGTFAFSGFNPGHRRDTQIEVRFEINAEGLVRVSARDPKTGAENHTTVSMTSGLSEDELRDIIARNRAADVATEGVDADDPVLGDDDGLLGGPTLREVVAKPNLPARKPAPPVMTDTGAEIIPLPDVDEDLDLAVSDEDLADLPGLTSDLDAGEDAAVFDRSGIALAGTDPEIDGPDLSDLVVKSRADGDGLKR
jgi:molecular chaperone DnaK